MSPNWHLSVQCALSAESTVYGSQDAQTVLEVHVRQLGITLQQTTQTIYVESGYALTRHVEVQVRVSITRYLPFPQVLQLTAPLSNRQEVQSVSVSLHLTHTNFVKSAYVPGSSVAQLLTVPEPVLIVKSVVAADNSHMLPV